MRPSALLAVCLLAQLTQACNYPVNLTDVQVWDLSPSASGAASPAACADACCALGSGACDTWQWCPGGGPAPLAGCGAAQACWVGIGSGQHAAVPGWISASSRVPPPPASSTFINASLPPPPAVAIPGLPSVTSPDGRVLSIDTASLLLDGARILPFAGEMHFSRVPREAWAADLAAMKSGGLDIVQAYVFWLHTEEIQGQQDWWVVGMDEA